jgi:hypothetical protein
MSQGGGDAGGSREAVQADGNVAEGSHHLGCAAGAATIPGSLCRIPRRAGGSGTSLSTSIRLAGHGSCPAGHDVGEDDIGGCGFRRMTVRCENHHQNRAGHIRPTRHAAHPPRTTSSRHDHLTLPQPAGLLPGTCEPPLQRVRVAVPEPQLLTFVGVLTRNVET